MFRRFRLFSRTIHRGITSGVAAYVSRSGEMSDARHVESHGYGTGLAVPVMVILAFVFGECVITDIEVIVVVLVVCAVVTGRVADKLN
jgi:hypothetical protein